VLILAYSFPPEQSGGTGRPFSLYQHLPSYDVKPCVVTITHNQAENSSNNIFRFDSLQRRENISNFDKKFFFRIVNKFIKYFGFYLFFLSNSF